MKCLLHRGVSITLSWQLFNKLRGTRRIDDFAFANGERSVQFVGYRPVGGRCRDRRQFQRAEGACKHRRSFSQSRPHYFEWLATCQRIFAQPRERLYNDGFRDVARTNGHPTQQRLGAACCTAKIGGRREIRVITGIADCCPPTAELKWHGNARCFDQTRSKRRVRVRATDVFEERSSCHGARMIRFGDIYTSFYLFESLVAADWTLREVRCVLRSRSWDFNCEMGILEIFVSSTNL